MPNAITNSNKRHRKPEGSMAIPLIVAFLPLTAM